MILKYYIDTILMVLIIIVLPKIIYMLLNSIVLYIYIYNPMFDIEKNDIPMHVRCISKFCFPVTIIKMTEIIISVFLLIFCN